MDVQGRQVFAARRCVNRAALGVLLALGAGALAWSTRAGASVAPTLGNAAFDLEDFVSGLGNATWQPPERAAPYLAAIREAEDRHGIPRNLLARLLYQESRFRPDVIDGATRSSAGAIGIAQFMPAVAKSYGIDPTDPYQSIAAAAEELSKLYGRFGRWSDALAAYNWGQGNWNSFLRTGLGAKGQPRPEENVDYVSEITADVAVA